jgi:membrane protein insertase Oxa1/YidC/SpoIIIJ
MEKTVDYANDRGGCIEEYHPWILTDIMQNTFALVHEILPQEFGWLGSVAIAAVGIRALIFPLCLQSIREGRLKSSLLPQYSEMIREMNEMKTPTGGSTRDQEKLQSLQRRYMAFTSKYGNVALKGTLASGIQIPMIMTGIVACNGIAMNPTLFPSVALESPLWIESASLPDPYYILPAINALLVWSNMRVFGSIDATATPKLATRANSSGIQEDEQTKRIKDLITSRMSRDSADRTSAQLDSLYKSKFMKYGKKIFPLLIFGITSKFPAITILYTISNILGAMFQNCLVSSRRFQTMFEIPAQARASGNEVEEAIRRADEVREKINAIVAERKSKKNEAEKIARDRFRRRSDPKPVVGSVSPRQNRTMDDLLKQVMERHG